MARELEWKLTCSQKTVVNHLPSFNGKVQKLSTWVPHALTKNNKLQLLLICLLIRSLLVNLRTNFFNRSFPATKIGVFILAWTKKQNKKQTIKTSTAARKSLHLRKAMLCIWRALQRYHLQTTRRSMQIFTPAIVLTWQKDSWKMTSSTSWSLANWQCSSSHSQYGKSLQPNT